MKALLHTLALAALLAASPAAAETLVAPKVSIADPGLAPAERESAVLAARRYATFWNTGDPSYAKAALAEDFADETPPAVRIQGPAASKGRPHPRAGRIQGPTGPLLPSETFRKAVPDLTYAVEQMIVAGDRTALHLRLTGHFTGTFGGRQGQGQPVSLIATDIYRVTDGRIAANWPSGP